MDVFDFWSPEGHMKSYGGPDFSLSYGFSEFVSSRKENWHQIEICALHWSCFVASFLLEKKSNFNASVIETPNYHRGQLLSRTLKDNVSSASMTSGRLSFKQSHENLPKAEPAYFFWLFSITLVSQSGISSCKNNQHFYCLKPVGVTVTPTGWSFQSQEYLTAVTRHQYQTPIDTVLEAGAFKTKEDRVSVWIQCFWLAVSLLIPPQDGHQFCSARSALFVTEKHRFITTTKSPSLHQICFSLKRILDVQLGVLARLCNSSGWWHKGKGAGHVEGLEGLLIV